MATIPQTNVSMDAIDDENTAYNPYMGVNVSLKSLSDTAAVGSDPRDGAPYGMGEFRGYSHTITNAYSATGAYVSWGKASRVRVGRVQQTYYAGGVQGSGGTPSPLSNDGWGLSMTPKVAAWYSGPNASTYGFRWVASSSSSTGADLTWWNKATISRSGQTDVVLLRSAATTNYHSNYSMHIFWPTSTTVNYICNGAFTWTFTS